MKCKIFALIDSRGCIRKHPPQIGDSVDVVNGEASAFRGDRQTAKLTRAIVISVTADGLFVEGFEPLADPRRLIWQRWWCAVGDGKDGAK